MNQDLDFYNHHWL